MIGRALLALAAAVVGGCGRSSKPAVGRDGGGEVVAVHDAAPRREPPPVREVVIVRKVALDIVAPTGSHAPAREPLVARLGRLGAGAVTDAAAVPPGWAGRTGSLRAVLTYDLGGLPRVPTVLMTVEAAVELDGDALGVAARAAGEAAIGKASKPAAVDELAVTLVDQVATELTNKLTLRSAPGGELLVAATGDDPEAAAWALELAGERHDPALRAPAIDALGKSPRLRTAAIQYLVALGDRTAVSDLAASVDFAEPEELAAIIEAVTAIGGDDARDFLELLASGATDEDIAKRAREGLDRLDRREDAGP